MKKNIVLLSLVFLLLSGGMTLSGQSNLIIDNLLEEEQATFGKTAYLAMTAAGLAPEDASPEQALAVLERQEWGIKVRGAGDPVKLGEYSFMLMKAFDLTGGLMYRILPGPRYACRELAYLGFIDGNSSPYRTLSGEEVMRILGRVLEYGELRS